MKRTHTLNLLLALLITAPLLSTLHADSSGKTLDMTFSVREGTGDDPQIVIWLENDMGDFIQTLQMFATKKPYYKDMLSWYSKSRKTEKAADIDAVTGATIRWKRKATISIPAQIGEHDLLNGEYVLRIESRKDKGKHYRKFQIPLVADYAGGTHEDPGYVKSIEIKINDTAK